MSSFDLASYFSRIGHEGSREATLETLRELHGQHPQAIVFENIDVLLKRPIRLDPDALFAKLVTDARGGYCYEQNTLFKSALEAIGFSVRSLGAEVLWRYPPGPARSRSHMLLAIALPDGDYIADVGFVVALADHDARLFGEPGGCVVTAAAGAPGAIDDMLAVEIGTFLDGVRSGEHPGVVTLTDARNGLAAMEAILASLATGQVVTA